MPICVKSGKKVAALISTAKGAPLSRYEMARITRIIAGNRIPRKNPAFAICAVCLVPPNWVSARPQRITRPAMVLTTGSLSRAGQARM